MIEAEKNIKPVVLTSVTLGKELHAGHMLLLSTADLLRRGLGVEEPVVLVNNNTGPRAAGALLSLAEEVNLATEDMARLLSRGLIVPNKIIEAYRGRIEEEERLFEVMDLLDMGDHDIFKIMADSTEDKLKKVGFDVSVIPESGNLKENQEVVDLVNPLWGDSGFMFYGEKGIRILRRGGQLTASGKCLVSLASLGKQVVERDEIPLVIFVDSAPDTADAVVSYSSLEGLGQAMQLPGAGIGFEGKIASGSKGEALTQDEIFDLFLNRCPRSSLSQALRHMVLTRPVSVPFSKTPNLADGIFDFKDNDAFLEALAECSVEANHICFEGEELISELKDLVGEETKANEAKTDRWLSFLPQRTKSFMEVPPDRVIESMKNVDRVLKDRAEIELAVSRQGYKEEELERRVSRYLNGPEGLVLRDNYYLGILRSIKNIKGKILSLTEDDFGLLELTIRQSIRRLGYEKMYIL